MLQEWFSPAEHAAANLPGLSSAQRKINARAKDECWALATDQRGNPLARRRAGKGGGYEYHVSLFPAAARAELARRAQPQDGYAGDNAGEGSPDQWQWFARQSAQVKAEAERRISVISQIEMFEASGMTRSAAVAATSAEAGVGTSTLWNWLKLVDGVTREDRLPALAPRRQGGGKEQEIDPEIWQWLLSDYLRPSQPSWTSCYRRAERQFGVAMPHARTLLRKLEREVPQQVVILRRKGEEELRRMLPPQIRSVADLHALELVNIDGHRCDVFVRMPNGQIKRPTMIAIQDVYSRKFLAWRHAETEDMVTARLVFADLFAKWGIPKGLLSDNGRAFASKWLTGGAKTRFRFKIRDEDPVGLLTNLGIHIHWAKPYRGQSKPIERGFRDLCDAVAKHPAFEGAYTGNRPDAKPENYGSKAIDLETFLQVWNAGMHAHNAQLGRRTEMGMGKHSFDQVFDESYVRSPIGKATEEQLRMALFAAEHVSTDRKSGAVSLGGNSYWCEELSEYSGQKLLVRFDPDDLTKPVHVYDRNGRFLVTAPLWEATGFLDMEAAKRRQRLERTHRKKTREALDALDLLSADEMVARLPQYDEPEAAPAAPVVRPVRTRGNTAAALKTVSQTAEAHLSATKEAPIDRMARAMERHLTIVKE